jgi:hypothetical protein
LTQQPTTSLQQQRRLCRTSLLLQSSGQLNHQEASEHVRRPPAQSRSGGMAAAAEVDISLEPASPRSTSPTGPPAADALTGAGGGAGSRRQSDAAAAAATGSALALQIDHSRS